MRTLVFLLIYVSIVGFLTSCEKEENTPNMSGQFQLEIESSKNLKNLSLQRRTLSPVEAPSADIEFKWEEIRNDGNFKVFRSTNILMGHYYFEFTVKYLEENGNYSYGPTQYHTIQIIPGEVTKVSNIYYP